VDANDTPIGIALKHEAHGIQPLWPLAWANACCSHPAPSEPVDEAAIASSQRAFAPWFLLEWPRVHSALVREAA